MSFDFALIDSDLSLKQDGTMRTVDRADKLKQDIVKMILTPITSVKFHLWYGSAIDDSAIGDIVPENILSLNLTTAITDSLAKLQKLQRAQATTQLVTLAEMLGEVKEILVQRNPSDTRQINVIVLAVSKDFNAVEEIFTVGT